MIDGGVYRRAKAALNPPSPTTDTPSPHLPAGPKKDYSLKEGQTFSISIPGKSSSKSGGTSLLTSSGTGNTASGGSIPLLPPPPGRR